MKKLTNKIRISLIHFGFWFLYAFLLFMVFNFMIHGNVNQNLGLLKNIFIWYLILPALSSYLVYYFLVFKSFVKSDNLLKPIFTAGISSLAIAFIFTLYFELQTVEELTFKRINSVSFSLYIFNVFLCTVVGGIAFIIRTFNEWFVDQKLKKELKEKNEQMELEIVKAQLDPHFLFNSLNNIDVLILQDPQKASDYLNKLSELLRYTLNPSKKEQISLAQEVDYIKKYIDLQKVRNSNASFIEIVLNGNLESKELPPFLFIPFLENAFKYHQYTDKDAKIRIAINVADDEIQFSCSNKISNRKDSDLSSFQIGNELIKKRLNLLYPQSHELKIKSDGENYQVTLILR